MAAERETLTYETSGAASRELARQVADDGFDPDLILSIARGGLFLGGALGYALDVKNLFVMNVESAPSRGPSWACEGRGGRGPSTERREGAGRRRRRRHRQDPRAGPRLLRRPRDRGPDGG